MRASLGQDHQVSIVEMDEIATNASAGQWNCTLPAREIDESPRDDGARRLLIKEAPERRDQERAIVHAAALNVQLTRDVPQFWSVQVTAIALPRLRFPTASGRFSLWSNCRPASAKPPSVS